MDISMAAAQRRKWNWVQWLHFSNITKGKYWIPTLFIGNFGTSTKFTHAGYSIFSLERSQYLNCVRASSQYFSILSFHSFLALTLHFFPMLLFHASNSQYNEWLRARFFVSFAARGIAVQSDIHLISYLFACLAQIHFIWPLHSIPTRFSFFLWKFHLLKMLLANSCASFDCPISWSEWECKNQIQTYYLSMRLTWIFRVAVVQGYIEIKEI